MPNIEEMAAWAVANPTPGRRAAGRITIQKHFNCPNNRAKQASKLALQRAAGQAPIEVTPPALSATRKFDPADPAYRAPTVEKLRQPKGAMSIAELAAFLGTDETNAMLMLHSLKQVGYAVDEIGGRYAVGGLRPDSVPTMKDFSRLLADTYTAGFLADNHLASLKQRLDVAEMAYQEFARRKVKDVYQCGNMIDGYAERINGDEVMFRNVTDQCMYAADNYPQRAGITTYFITGECFDPKTEIMTGRGFIPVAEVTEQDTIATLNLSALAWEWQRPVHLVAKQYRGSMYHFKSQKIDLLMTGKHRVLYKRRWSNGWHHTPAHEYEKGQNQFFKGCTWAGRETDTIEIPAGHTTHPWLVKIPRRSFPARVFMRFMGWFLSEGYVSETRISIAQMPGSTYCEEIATVIHDLGFTPRKGKTCTSFCSLPLSQYLSPLCGAGKKALPAALKDLAAPLLWEFLEAYWKGDGHHCTRQYGCELESASTASKQLASDIVEAAMKCGYGAMFSEWDRRGEAMSVNGHAGVRRHKQYNICLSRNIWPHYRGQPTKVDYSGMVYCVDVPNETLLVRRNGRICWCHNCHEGWFGKSTGLNIGWHIEDVFRRQGREDLKYAGHMERDFELKTKGASSTLRVFHPGGGSAYALSYRPQKIIESLSGGEKPAILVLGHFHKLGYLLVRNVHCLLAGCCQDQTRFMRKHSIEAHVGFTVLTVALDKQGGIARVVPEITPFYDAGYHFDAGEWESALYKALAK